MSRNDSAQLTMPVTDVSEPSPPAKRLQYFALLKKAFSPGPSGRNVPHQVSKNKRPCYVVQWPNTAGAFRNEQGDYEYVAEGVSVSISNAAGTDAALFGLFEYPGANVHQLYDVSTLSLQTETAISDPSQPNFLQVQRLRSQLIAEQRALLVAKKSVDDLTAEKTKLVDTVCDLAASAETLKKVMFGAKSAEICLVEIHQGSVSEIIGDQIEITYETPEGALKQIYDRKQFKEKVPLKEGDQISAHVSLAIVKEGGKPSTAVDYSSALPSFQDRGVTGEVRI